METLILLPLLNHLFSDVMEAGGKLMTSLIFLYIFITITNELKSIILLIRDLTADTSTKKCVHGAPVHHQNNTTFFS